MIWVLALTSKKYYYKNNNTKTAHLPLAQPTPSKILHDKGSISGPRESVHRSFMKQYNLCTYFNQQLSVGIYTDQIHLQ